MKDNHKEIDLASSYFLLNLAALIAMGLIMVWSASYMYGKENFGSSSFFALRQILFIGIGAIIAFVVGRTKLSFWIKFGHYINAIMVFILLLTLVSGVAVCVKGACRWLPMGPMNFQPGEFIKYTIIVASVHYFEMFFDLSKKQKVIQGLFLFAPLLILINQPDFGSTLICFSITIFVCFMSTFPRKYFFSILAVGFAAGLVALFSAPYRVERVFSYLDPWKNPKTSGFQIIQSYLAFANGSFFGTGMGNSNEKLFYLPEAHNDFIFSVIGEELGFVGVLLVAILFVSFIFFGFRLACKLQNRLGLILTVSVVFMIGFQALLNMGVVLGLLPTKGLNLPFISYGGASIIANLFGVGLIFSAVRQTRKIAQIDQKLKGSMSVKG